MKIIITFTSLMVICLSTFTQESSIYSPAPSWYVESLINTHHSAGSVTPEWDVQFERVRPDAVAFHSRAYSAGKALAAKYNIAFVTTLSRSGHWDDVSAIVEALPIEEQALFKWRINPDGSPAGRMRDGEVTKHLCLNSPGIDKYIIPIYKSTTEQFHPAQYWIDHTIVTINLCYCDYCKNNFMTQYGADPPISEGDPNWDNWVTFHRNVFELWMKKVVDGVKSIDEKTMATFNGAYFTTQPEQPPSYIKNLSLDIHSQLMYLCVSSRYATTVGLPFDLMPGLTNTWAGTVAKTEQEVKQAAAIITANGGRWNIGEFPMTETLQPAVQMLELAAAGADQVRERSEWIRHTNSSPLVAVLQSASTQYARVIPKGNYVYNIPGLTRLFWYDNLYAPNEIYGASAALVENNIPFDIINEAALKKRLKEYKLLIVGDQFRLDTETVSAIRSFVEAGGGLLATGRTIESELADLIGVRFVNKMSELEKIIRIGNTDVPLDAPLQVEVNGAAVILNYSGASGTPAIIRHNQGNGRILYVAGDFFKAYMDASPYNPKSLTRIGNTAMRNAIEGWIYELSPDLGYECIAPPWIEVAMRSKGKNLLFQLVERTFEWKKDIYQTTAPLEFKLVMKIHPENVLLQPGNRKINWGWRNDTLFATVPLNEIKTHSILEIKDVIGYNFSHDTISNIPFGTRIDTLYRRLGKNADENWSINFVDGIQRADIKTGDKLIITNPDNSLKEYYLELDIYKKSSDASLGSIYIFGDTLSGFKPYVYNYTEILPGEKTSFPAISANPTNVNAKVLIEKPININGGPEHRTAKIHVIAEDDSTELIYTVTFEVMKEKEPFHADPFFSGVMNGLYSGTSASGWGKGFEIFNPGSTIIPMGDYIIANASAGTLSSVLASKDMLFKMRPGYTLDSSRISTGIYYNSRQYPFETDLGPGKTLVFGRGYPEGWTSTNVFRDLCDFRDTNGDLAYASNLYGFVDGARICFFGVNNSLYLIRIDNDSIFEGLKSANDPNDFSIVDIFGTQGANNNRIIEGVFVSDMSATSLERKKEIWKGNPINYGSFGSTEPGSSEWDKYQGMMHIGTHEYTLYTGHHTTVYSLLYKVSSGFGSDQSIGLVPPGTTAAIFLSNVFPNVSDAILNVTNSDSSVLKTGTDLLVEGDKLCVVSSAGNNSTTYKISIQQPGNDALLTSSSYFISVSGQEGMISGIPSFTTLEELLVKINVPAGAKLSVIDSRGQQVGNERVLFDTLIIVKTIVSDSIMLEVIAEDGLTKIVYTLSILTDLPYVISDFYLVMQNLDLIDMFQAKTTVRTFLSRLVPSTGAGMSVIDKLGNKLSIDGIMSKDDRLLVSDGINSTTYLLKDMYASVDASLKNIIINDTGMEGFDPAVTLYTFVLNVHGIPEVPIVTATTNHGNASVIVTQAENLEGTEAERTSTIKVVAEDGFGERIYSVIFVLNIIKYSDDASLKNIKVNGIPLEGFNPAIFDYIVILNQSGGMPQVPIIESVTNFVNASLLITQAENLNGSTNQRTATIKVIAENGLTENYYTVLFNLNVGLKNTGEEFLNIYSKAETIFIETASLGDNNEVEVYDLHGRKILSKKLTSTFERIILNYPFGSYIVKVRYAGRLYIEKVVAGN